MSKKIAYLVLIGSLILGCATLGIKPPTLLKKVEPDYPREAEEKELEGRVEMYLLVTKTGDVSLVRISKSSGFKILDNAAIEYAKKLRFDPATEKGNPINVWLSWMVNYETIAGYFVPKVYVGKVLELFELADQFNGDEKKRILQEILYEHEDYIRHILENPHLNYNEEIINLVSVEVYECWENLWQYWPLGFVVFHDFVIRYPDSEHVAYATARLLSLIKTDIERIKDAALYDAKIRKKKDLFFKTIYTFLNDKYPQAITEELKVEAAKYLKK